MAASLATIETGMPRLIDRAQAWATGDVQRIQSVPESAEVAACRAAITVDPGAGDLYTLLRQTWMENMERHLQSGGVTLAVVSMDMLLDGRPVSFGQALVPMVAAEANPPAMYYGNNVRLTQRGMYQVFVRLTHNPLLGSGQPQAAQFNVQVH